MKHEKPGARGEARDPRERDRPGEGPLGTHPVGTVVGGTAGALAAGAAVGSVAGPIGAAVGAAIGAAAGGMSGKLVADLADPQMEDAFWRKNWSDRKYIDGGFTYDQDWAPAYRHGVEAHQRYPGRHHDEIEPQLEAEWAQARGESRLDWPRARHASRDAWLRVYERGERQRSGETGDDDQPPR